MKYEEYMKKYNYCFGHDCYAGGERMVPTLKELLEHLQEEGWYPCPRIVDGGVPVKIEIDAGTVMCWIEDNMCDHDYAGEGYEMPDKGREFLMNCLKEYNEKYATNGNCCDTAEVEVPEEMRYESEGE